MPVTISMATEIDGPKIKAFIEKVGAPPIDADGTTAIHYLVAKDEEAEIVGVVGILTTNDVLLLRHLIIDPKRCDMAMLLQIIEHAVAFGASNKLKRTLFLTPAPPRLFEPIGFVEVSAETLGEEVKSLLPLEKENTTQAHVLLRELA